MTFTHNYVTAAPEIFLAIASMVLLMIGVFRGDGSTRLLSYLAVLAFADIFSQGVGADCCRRRVDHVARLYQGRRHEPV